MSEPSRFASARWDVAIGAALAIGYAALCHMAPVLLATPVFDETYTLPSAREIAHGLPAFEQTHPPLAKLLMGLGYWCWLKLGLATSPDEWTNVALGARLFGPLAAGLGLGLVYGLGRSLSGLRRVGLLAALLLACDGVYFIMARIAMTNVYGVCFVLLGALASWLALKRADPRWLWPAGLAFGLAMASRWTSSVAFALLCGFGLCCLPREDRRRWLAHGLPALGLLAPVVYFTTYLQPMLASHGWRWSALLEPATWGQVAGMQAFMLHYHTVKLPPQVGESPWWSWPLLLKPAWFYYGSADRGETLMGLLAVGNAFIWWASVPAMAIALLARRRELAFPAVMAAGLWLVWALAGSNTSYMHYMLEAIPFVCILLAWGLVRGAERLGNLGPILAGAYVFLVAWWFWYYQPLLSARPLPLAQYVDRLWLGFDRWDAVAQLYEYRIRLGLQDDEAFKAFMRANFPESGRYFQVLEQWETPAGLPAAKARPSGP